MSTRPPRSAVGIALALFTMGPLFAAPSGCSGSTDAGAAAAPQTARDAEEIALSFPCNDSVCTTGEMCVETQGALCRALPPPGESCPDGCVRTEHCCNCSAFACFQPHRDSCPEGPDCACLDRPDGTSVLADCADDRRECSEEADSVHVLCIRVALDEDPFADAGVGGP